MVNIPSRYSKMKFGLVRINNSHKRSPWW